MINWPSKTVPEFKDYGLDWRPALSKLAGDPTIVNSVWAKLSGPATITGGIIQADNKRTAVKIGAGDPLTVTIVRNTVTLSTGPILTCDALIRVRA